MPHPEWPPPSRPWCCPEPTCTPFMQFGESMDLAKPEMGLSWLCLGKMEQPRTFIYDGVEHTNDLNDCHYSPLKGVIRWEENAADIGGMASTYTLAVARLSEQEQPDD